MDFLLLDQIQNVSGRQATRPSHMAFIRGIGSEPRVARFLVYFTWDGKTVLSLTGGASFITLRIPMRYRVRFLFLFVAACVAFPGAEPGAPVVFRPGAKVK